MKVTVEGQLPPLGVVEPNQKLFQNKNVLVLYGSITYKLLHKILVSNLSNKPTVLDKGNKLGCIEEAQCVQQDNNIRLCSKNKVEILLNYIQDYEQYKLFDDDLLNLSPNLALKERVLFYIEIYYMSIQIGPHAIPSE